MECLQRVVNPLGACGRRPRRERKGKLSKDTGACDCHLEDDIQNKGWRLRTTRTVLSSSKTSKDSETFHCCCHGDESTTQTTTEHHPLHLHIGSMRKKELLATTKDNHHQQHHRSLQHHQYAYLSNHVVVNQERTQRNLPALVRCSILDEMARGKAQEMAAQQRLLTPYASETMVENVQRGPSLQIIHQLIMHGLADNPQRSHILDPRFVKFGMGTAQCSVDGNVYLSQLFQGPPLPREKRLSHHGTLVGQEGLTALGHSRSTTTIHSDPTSQSIVKNVKTRPVPVIDKYIPPLRRQQRHHK